MKREMKEDLWALIGLLCAAYVFVGLAVFVYALPTKSWLLIGLAVVAYVLNIALLNYAKKHSW